MWTKVRDSGNRPLLAAALLAVLLGSAPGCGEADAPASSPETEVRLGDRVAGVGEMHRFLLREIGLPPAEIDERALPAYRRHLATQILFARAATRIGLEAEPAEMQAEQRLLRQLDPAADEEQLKKEARRAVLARAYEAQVLARRVEVTPEEVEARLGSRPRDERRTAVFRQIVVDEESEAREVHRRLAREGEPFEEVAKEVSTGPELGALQQVPMSHLPESVQHALRRTPEGTVSRPVEIEGSHYLFEVQALNRDPDPARRREREEVRRRLFREKLDALREEHVGQLARSEGVALPPGGDV